MQIIIPMSGIGQRFLDAGYEQPKPLIIVEQKPMIAHVISMFPHEHDMLFICNEGHLNQTPIAQTLKSLVPKAKICAIPAHKRGPVHTVLEVKNLIDDNTPTLINYCDFFAYWDYSQFKNLMLSQKYDGAVTCYRGFHPHLLLNNLYAGVRADGQNQLLEIREKHCFSKDPMNCWQSAGTYYFNSGKLLKKYFSQLVEKNIHLNNEFYVSSVYQLLVEDGLNIHVYPVEYFCQWGTPTDLKIYESYSNYFRALVSAPGQLS